MPFRFGQCLRCRGNARRRWRHIMSTRKLFTGKAQNLSCASGISTVALAIVSLQEKIKRNVVLPYCLVGVVDGVLVLAAQFPSGNRGTQRIGCRFGLNLLACADHVWWRLNLALCSARD